MQDLNLSEDDAERIANRILEQFDIDVRSDDQFEQLCDVIEMVGRLRKPGADPDPNIVCREIGKVNLPKEIACSLLLVLLKDPFKRLRQRAVELSEAERIAASVMG